MARICWIVNGPNLNMLGQREPEIYGTQTLADIESSCNAHAQALGLKVHWVQSNHEGELVQAIQEAAHSAKTEDIAGLIINAGAYTHTSVAILDALLLLKIPVVEVHLSNLFRREAFRHESYVSRAATGMICGFGAKGYLLAMDALAAK